MASYGEWPAIPGHPGLSHAAAETEELLSHAIEETRSHPRPPRHEPAWMRNRSEALAMAGFASVKGQISAQPRPQKVGYNTHRILSARTRPPPDAENVDSLRKEYTAGAASGGSRGKVALKPSSAPMAHNRSGSARLLGNRSAGMRPQTAKSEPGVGVGLGPGVGVGLGPESGLPEPRKKFGRATSLTLKKWEKPAISQAMRETRQSLCRHLFANETPPMSGNLFALTPREFAVFRMPVNTSRSNAGTEESPLPAGGSKKAAEVDDGLGREGGVGLVVDGALRCKRGVQVRIATSFWGEAWALPHRHSVGTLHSSSMRGSWLVQFPGARELVECSCGLLGRCHMVYAEGEESESEDEALLQQQKGLGFSVKQAAARDFIMVGSPTLSPTFPSNLYDWGDDDRAQVSEGNNSSAVSPELTSLSPGESEGEVPPKRVLDEEGIKDQRRASLVRSMANVHEAIHGVSRASSSSSQGGSKPSPRSVPPAFARTLSMKMMLGGEQEAANSPQYDRWSRIPSHSERASSAKKGGKKGKGGAMSPEDDDGRDDEQEDERLEENESIAWVGNMLMGGMKRASGPAFLF